MTDNAPETATLSVSAQRMHKRHLRRALRAARTERAARGNDDARRRDAERLRDHALAHPALALAGCVTSFESMPTEHDLTPLNEELRARGVRVIVPITLENLDLSWRDLATGEDLGQDGIALADVVIAPALAVSPRGDRLGQGGGCYDKALPRRRSGAPVVAVVFPEEFGLDIPTEPHDARVDAVLTVDGVVSTRDAGPEHGTNNPPSSDDASRSC